MEWAIFLDIAEKISVVLSAFATWMLVVVSIIAILAYKKDHEEIISIESDFDDEKIKSDFLSRIDVACLLSRKCLDLMNEGIIVKSDPLEAIHNELCNVYTPNNFLSEYIEFIFILQRQINCIKALDNYFSSSGKGVNDEDDVLLNPFHLQARKNIDNWNKQLRRQAALMHKRK